ncbi:hypothetical protein BH11MYX4_BH11MYX4_32890 [soil metagenome]
MKTARRKDTTTAARWTAGALMSPQPVTIGRHESLATAHRLMTENAVRHLPVLEHGELVGVLSQRDLFLVESIRSVKVDVDTVDDAMSSDTYAVGPDEPIATVAKHMMRKRYGCAVVMERGRVIGIFTVTDALRLVSALAPAPEVVKPHAERS